MSDEEQDDRPKPRTGWMYPELRQAIELARTDAEVREEFNKGAPDLVLRLITEIEILRDTLRLSRGSIEALERMNEDYKEMADWVHARVAIMYEDLEKRLDLHEVCKDCMLEVFQRHLEEIERERRELGDYDEPVN